MVHLKGFLGQLVEQGVLRESCEKYQFDYRETADTATKTRSWFIWKCTTYIQPWLVGINVVYKLKLCHKVLGHTPRSINAHCQGICYFSVNPMKGRWEVSGMQNNRKDRKKKVIQVCVMLMNQKVELQHKL